MHLVCVGRTRQTLNLLDWLFVTRLTDARSVQFPVPAAATQRTPEWHVPARGNLKSTQIFPQGSLSTLPERPTGAAWVVVIAWLVATGMGLWHFESRDWRPFSTQQTQMFQTNAQPQLERWYRESVNSNTSAKLTVVYVYRVGCRCNEGVQSDSTRLMDRFRARGVRFLAATLPVSEAPLAAPQGMQWASEQTSLPNDAGIHVGPAALIFDHLGRLMYYGPYRDAAWCGGSGLLLDRALEDALKGQAPRTGSVARGCFCAG
jgi:hypothetical protein